MRGAPEEGTPAHDPGVDPQRLPRDVADRLPRGRVRPRADRADDGRRHRRHRSSACSSTTSRSTSRPRGSSATSGCSTCGPACSAARPSSRRRAAAGCSCAPAGSRRWSDRHLAAIRYEVDALDGPMRVDDLLRARHPGAARERGRPAPRPRLRREAAGAVAARARRARAPLLHLATRNSGLELACGMEHRIEPPRRRDASSRAPATAPASTCRPISRPAPSLRL